MSIKFNTSPQYSPPIWLKLISFLFDIMIGGKSLDDEKISPFKQFGINNTQSIEYDELYQIFDKNLLNFSDFFIDIGCGRGRVFNYLLLIKRYKGKMYGIEIDPEIADFVAKRLNHTKVKIICGNAVNILHNINRDTCILFMYNPFKDTEMMKSLLIAIESNFSHTMLVYYNPKHLHMIQNRNNWSCSVKMIKSIARKQNIACAYLEFRK